MGHVKTKIAPKKPSAIKSPKTSATKSPKKSSGKPEKKSARRGDPKAKKRRVVPAVRTTPSRRRTSAASASPTASVASEKEKRESLQSAKAAIAAALDKKAVEPVLIDVCGRASYADFIGVVSGRSDRQVDAIADGICDAMAARGRRPLGQEGLRNGRWVLIDFGDLVMHVFYHPLREVFDLESLWIDAPRVKLHIPAEARADAESGRDKHS